MKTKKEAILCYVDGHFAYFTTQELGKQTGDDWDDIPYEHNAGEPYTPTVYHYADGTNKNDLEDWTDGKPNWEIKKVCFFAYNLHAPCDVCSNSPFSVDTLNAKNAPWLKSYSYSKPQIEIWAGCSIDEFKKLIRKGGGKIYEESKD